MEHRAFYLLFCNIRFFFDNLTLVHFIFGLVTVLGLIAKSKNEM